MKKEKVKVVVPVPEYITEEQIRICANIHYIEVVRIDKTRAPGGYNDIWEVQIECDFGNTMLATQIYQFGENIGREILHYQQNKPDPKNRSYKAGYDYVLNGVNKETVHYMHFTTKENSKQWQLGQRQAEIDIKNPKHKNYGKKSHTIKF